MAAESKTSAAGRRWLIRIAVPLLAPLAMWPWLVQMPPGGIEDDGFFYAQIAYNAGVHGTFSFDGLHPTDGFHLLWGLLLAAASALTGLLTETKELHLYVHCVVASAVLVAVADRFGTRAWDRVLLFVLGLAGTVPVETPLVALLALALMAVAGVAEGRRDGAALMALAALLVLARVDAASMALAAVALLLARRRYRWVLWLLAGLFLGLALQMSLNRWLAGEWTSVAAQMKGARALLRLQSPAINLTAYTGRTVLLLSLLVAGAWTAWRQFGAGDRSAAFLWLAAAAFTVPHLLVSFMRSWYFVPGFLLLTVLAIRVRDGGAPPARLAARSTLLLASSTPCGGTPTTRRG